jgi:hypothetical protein
MRNALIRFKLLHSFRDTRPACEHAKRTYAPKIRPVRFQATQGGELAMRCKGLASLVVLVMLLIRLPKEEQKLIERLGDEGRA